MLKALQTVMEANVALAHVEERVKGIDRSLPRLEYARRLLPVLTLPPIAKTAAEPAGGARASVPIATSDAASVAIPAQPLDSTAVIADLRNPAKRDAALERLFVHPNPWDHPELIPVLTDHRALTRAPSVLSE